MQRFAAYSCVSNCFTPTMYQGNILSTNVTNFLVFLIFPDGIHAGAGHGTRPREGLALARRMDSQNQQFCLKWNSFGSNLATAFGNLFKSESLTDVTLFCDGESIWWKAGVFVLNTYNICMYGTPAACSRQGLDQPSANRLFISCECTHSRIYSLASLRACLPLN